MTAADCTILDDTPSEFTPIVQMIDNFERNHKLGNRLGGESGQRQPVGLHQPPV